MAVYDSDAVASTTITAFLAQFKFSANGDIRFVAGTDTFHITWLHQAAQSIVYDFNVSGDDELNLSKPNPSTSQALGSIITLQDHTTAYAVRYNIDDTVAEYLFGGSVTQEGSSGTDSYRGIGIVGSVASATQLQIIQDNALLTSHWGTGKNQTTSQTLVRILIKTISNGTIIDGHRVIVKANEWGDTYAVWRTELGLTEGVAAINTNSDPQNDTLLATVQGYTGISNTEGYQQLDLGDGSGNKPYYSQWTYGGNNKKSLYEWVKAVMVRGTVDTIYGLDGDFFTGGPTFECDVDTSGGGTWVQNEVVSWTESGTVSTGVMMGADVLSDASTTQLWIHILTGINPTDGTVLSGATASNAVNVTVTNLIPSAGHLGVFTGSAWIGAYGVGYVPGELTSSDSVTPLNGTPLSPPNNVPIAVTVNGTTNSHVLLAIKDAGTGGVDQTQYTAAAGNNITDVDFVINQAIDSDTPPTGWILVLEGTTWEPLKYQSWTGSTFTLDTTEHPAGLPATYTAGKDVIVPILWDNVAADGGTASTSLIYSADIDVVGWVRQGSPGSLHSPVLISGTIGTAGLSLSVTLAPE